MASGRQKVTRHHQTTLTHSHTIHIPRLPPDIAVAHSLSDMEITVGPKYTYHMPTHFDVPPYALPRSWKNSEKINDFLNFSLDKQKECDISNNCGFVTQVAYKCLTAMGISCRVACGYQDFNGGYHPHMWLVFDGKPIDNTRSGMCSGALNYLIDNYDSDIGVYMEAPLVNDDGTATDTPPPTKTFENKKKEDPETIKNEELSLMRKKWRIDFYYSHCDMALALSINRHQAYSYYFSMIRYVAEKYNATIRGIEPRLRFRCWACGKFPRGGLPYFSDVFRPDFDRLTDPESTGVANASWKFRQCARCMVANYCSRKCQQLDWKLRHNFICLSPEEDTLPGI